MLKAGSLNHMTPKNGVYVFVDISGGDDPRLEASIENVVIILRATVKALGIEKGVSCFNVYLMYMPYYYSLYKRIIV